ncbi:L-threonine ammonia-lyase-like [Protopterus annectens]|uniref:L-threonine ammonia-lyase-like n=1 Tax=Protopterus annectens TaxID=7888 RepID=UPI001CFA3583|nr:L-threonine ammonia-lyase-like [Protopterus annectens]
MANDHHTKRSPSINPERLKDFGEEEYLNGDIKTWEMKVVGCSETLLENAHDPTYQSANQSTSQSISGLLRFEDISAAAFKIHCGVQKTPCLYSRLSKQYGMDMYLKKEYLHYTGTVKERGVLYLLTALRQDQQRKGVIVASDSNFAMAVAYHATELHIPIFVIMSTNTCPMRGKMCREYGAMVILYGTTEKETQSHARRLAKENCYLYLEEEDSALYLAGLGTLGLEIYEQVPKLDAVIFPAGAHCGLLAGSAAALKHLNPHITVIGVEPESFPILQQSLKMGKPVTDLVCSNQRFYGDLVASSLGTNAFHLTKKLVDKVLTVRDEELLLAMLRFLEYERATVDAEGAVGLAAVLAGKLPELKGKKVAIAICSANMDLPTLHQCVDRGLTLDHRVCKFIVQLPDGSTELSKLVELLSREEARAQEIQQEHLFVTSDLFTVKVTCTVATREKGHATQVRNALTERYPGIIWLER